MQPAYFSTCRTHIRGQLRRRSISGGPANIGLAGSHISQGEEFFDFPVKSGRFRSFSPIVEGLADARAGHVPGVPFTRMLSEADMIGQRARAWKGASASNPDRLNRNITAGWLSLDTGMGGDHNLRTFQMSSFPFSNGSQTAIPAQPRGLVWQDRA